MSKWNDHFSYLSAPLVAALCAIGMLFLTSLFLLPRSNTKLVRRPASGLDPPSKLVSMTTFLLPLAFYLLSTPPSVGPVDAGSLSLAAWLPGVAHPPGFPLNMLLGQLGHALRFATRGWLPISVAHVLNVMCGLAGALTVHLIWR